MRTSIKLSEVVRDDIKGSFIGDILVQAGRLSTQDLDRIMALQQKEQMLFGTAAVSLGILAEDDVRWALSCQYSYPALVADSEASAELVAIREPMGATAETFRSIRSGMLLSGVGSLVKSIAVVSPAEGEGKTFAASNLATVFAQLGSRTLLLDLNFRNPRVHEVFQVKNNTGASSLIIKRALLEQAVTKAQLESLDVLASGPKPPNPLELLSWQDTRQLVAGLKDSYDVVIVDTPAFTKFADAMQIASLCDGALLVALKGKTKMNLLGQMKKQLDNAQIKILGSVINEIRTKKK